MNSYLVNIVLLYLLNCVQNGDFYMVGNNPYHRIETLDSKGKYQLEWRIDRVAKRVTFDVTVETKGYVGFGLSSRGKMRGADIVIGGVMPNGKSYFSDRHAIGNQMPEIDPSQDWTLLSARESETHTFLSFSRVFDTCDPQDYPITEDTITLIWAYGERDSEIGYHHRNRGEYQVYLIHPDYNPPLVRDPNVGAGIASEVGIESSSNSSPNNGNLKVWTVSSHMRIPSRDTTYWCTMHKAPVHQKHHIVGFEIRFPNEQSRRHVHHLAFSRCRAPRGRDDTQMFASYLKHRGQLCYNLEDPLGPIPVEYCNEFIKVWGVGGRPFFHPPHVGLPFGESPDEYYLLQVHYDNPDRLANLETEVFLDTYYTDQLRPNEGGAMMFYHTFPGLPGSLLIPPASVDHSVYGFCGRDCIREMLPPEGIRIYGLILHSHNAGVAIRLQQFRGNRELPWIQSDDNYVFDFQQIRVLDRETRVMPGDQLVAKCTYDSTASNGTVLGGHSSQQEMCFIFVYYYTKINNYAHCASQIDSEEVREKFLGIRNITWSNASDPPEYIVESPNELAGLTISQVSDNHVNWDAERREELQRFHLREPHVNVCPQELHSLPTSRQGFLGQSDSSPLRMVRYPYEVRPYRPKRSCSFQ